MIVICYLMMASMILIHYYDSSFYYLLVFHSVTYEERKLFLLFCMLAEPKGTRGVLNPHSD